MARTSRKTVQQEQTPAERTPVEILTAVATEAAHLTTTFAVPGTGEVDEWAAKQSAANLVLGMAWNAERQMRWHRDRAAEAARMVREAITEEREEVESTNGRKTTVGELAAQAQTDNARAPVYEHIYEAAKKAYTEITGRPMPGRKRGANVTKDAALAMIAGIGDDS